MKTDEIVKEMAEKQMKEGQVYSSNLFESSPQTGIFWILPDGYIAGWEYDPNLMPDADKVNPPIGHHEEKYLDQIKRMVPEWERERWDHLPRGRIIYIRSEKLFEVYIPSNYMNNEEVKSEILRRFSLPKTSIFKTNEH